MYRYLIIDDEELIRKGTIKKLAPLSDEIVCIGEAENGEDGIAMLKELSPDFVITDMQMPTMDGMKLLPYLAENYPSLPIIVISGYRDFDYIKQALSSNAIEYILKPFSRDAIQKSVRDAIAKLEDHSVIQQQIMTSEEEKEHAYYEYDIQLLSNLVLGYHTSDTTLSSKALNFINETHNMVLLTLHITPDFSDQLIREWIEEQGFGDLALYLPCTNQDQLRFIILFQPDQAVLSREDLATPILEELVTWLTQSNCKIIAGVSQTHSDLAQLNKAFLETSEALNQQYVHGDAPSYYFYDHDLEPRALTWDKKEEFLFRIETGMSDEVSSLTDELFHSFSQTPGFTLADAKYQCYTLSDQCRLMMNQYLPEQQAAKSSSSMQNIISHIFTLEDLKSYYLQFFLNQAALLKDQNVYAIDDVIEKVKIYIQRNYQKNLNQEFVSSLFYLNRSYLSVLFKSRTNEKFVDYLNDVRIEKAKDLLLDSNRKMYQIAKSVGYDNVKYFFRIFKKRTGITPEQFRATACDDKK